jgi:hypothetical protein
MSIQLVTTPNEVNPYFDLVRDAIMEEFRAKAKIEILEDGPGDVHVIISNAPLYALVCVETVLFSSRCRPITDFVRLTIKCGYE